MARHRCRRATGSKFGGPIKRGDPGSAEAALPPEPPVKRKKKPLPFSVQDPASEFQESQDPHTKKVNRRRAIRRISRENREKTQRSKLQKTKASRVKSKAAARNVSRVEKIMWTADGSHVRQVSSKKPVSPRGKAKDSPRAKPKHQ